MREQPYIATWLLAVVSLVGVIAIAVVRIMSEDPPAGLIALTASAVTGLVMASGRRRV